MADKRDQINWNSSTAIWSRVPSAKSAVTRACTAIDKLVERDFVFDTPAACSDARKRLTDAFDFCVELHDRWSDLETEAGTAAANEAAEASLKPYEERQDVALTKLNKYISKNSPTQGSARAASTPQATSAAGTPKISTCKLLFPSQLTKSNTPGEMRLWLASFRRFYDASNLDQQPTATQQGYFLQALDSSLQEILERQLCPETSIFGPAGCVDMLEAEFKSLYPVFNRRVDFFRVRRDQGEVAGDFYRRLAKLGDMADLEAVSKEDLTVFRFIDACEDAHLREKIFDLKRKDATAVREAIDLYDRQQKAEDALRKTAPIAAVNKSRPTQINKQPAPNSSKQPQAKPKNKPCKGCGGDHARQDCSVWKNQTPCNHCGIKGHLAKVCSSALKGKPGPARPVMAVSENPEDPDNSWVNRLTLNISHTNGSFNFPTFPDTGSAATLIAADLAAEKNIKPTSPSFIRYFNVCGDPVPTSGTVDICLQSSNHISETKAVITDAIKNEIIVGRDDLSKLGVISKQFPLPVYLLSEDKYTSIRESLIKDNPTVLTDDLPQESLNTGCIAMKVHLTPGERKPFRISTARQIPLHWRDKAEKIIKKLIDAKVITPQDEPTEWCAPGFFVAKKNGDIRLVIDYTKLNKYVQRPIHTFPSTQEILSGIDPDSKVFAKLDATQGYHQVPLDEESSKLTTFLLPSGRFRFLRAPMGLSCSSDEFCRRSDKVIEGLPGVRKLVDDILIQAPDIDTLRHRIDQLLARCRSHNFTLSRKKLEIGEAVEFAGQIVSHMGVRPNPEYLQGIKDFPAPKSVSELRSFLGMVNQLSTYHPGLAKNTGVLQGLLRKDTAYLWLEDHQAAFNQIKSDLLTTLALNHFDPSWDTRLITDASRLHGLGFVLMQTSGDNTKVVQCGSRTLSPAEKNYSTLELELTAIVWAIHKCSFFLKGIKHFEVVTDHRPLVGIFAKNLPQIDNSRITRLREKVLDQPFSVKWMAGKENVIADALSRAPGGPSSKDSTAIRSCIAAPESTLSKIIDNCRTDTDYRQIVEAFRQGRRLADLPECHPARRLKQVWPRLSLENNGVIVVDGDKLYLPPGTRRETLAQLHEGHCGYTKMLKTARALYFWPSMKYDIRSIVDNCEPCQRLQPSKPVEPFITTTASFPMEQISVDLFHVAGKTFMVTADRFSGYLWVDLLRKQDTKAITDVLDKITRIFGIPLRCRTDGGPQFRGPFDVYCKRKGIIHELSSPYNPQSNGHAEASVKIAKHLLLKSPGTNFPAALATWRNTDRDNKPSPNELMFCRKVRDEKPIMDSHLKARISVSDIGARQDIIHETHAIDQSEMQPQNRQRQQIPDQFQRGDHVLVQDPHSKRWEIEAVVTSSSRSNRSLHLETTEGFSMWRNRRFVRRLRCATPSS